MDKPLQKEQDTFRIPAYGLADARLSSTDAGYILDPNLINCYPIVTKDATTGEARIDVIKRPGSLTINALTPTIVSYGTTARMICLANEVITQLYDVYVAAFFDAASSKIYILQYRPIAATTTKIGEIASANINDLVFITEITNGDTLLPAVAISYQKADKSSGTGYYALTTAGVFTTSSLTAIASASFPSNLAGTPRIITGPFQYVDGHTFIMTVDGFIYMAGLTTAGNPDITSWNTNATVVASQYPDRGVGIFRYKQYLAAFGQDSVEFFADASNPPPGSTLERTDQLFIKFGAWTPKMIRNVDDALYWVSYSSVDTTGIWRLGGIGLPGYQPQRISTAKEEYWITNSGAGGGSQFSLETLILNHELHLLFNGYKVYSLAFGSGVASVSNASTDTYTISATTDVSANILAYAVTSGMWWGLNLCGQNDSSLACYVMPTTAYPAYTTAGQYQQYTFKRSEAGVNNNAVGATRPVIFYSNPTAGTYYDDVPEATMNKILPICVAITFPTVWNETEKRKSMKKVKIICDQITKAAGDTNLYSLYLMWNKVGNVNTTATTTVRTGIRVAATNVLVNTGQRYYYNTLGAYRQITFGLAFKSKDQFRIKALECDTFQRTH